MMNKYDVNIRVPAAEAKSDIILVSGVPSNVEAAKEGFAERMRELEAEKEERLKRSFEVRDCRQYWTCTHADFQYKAAFRYNLKVKSVKDL